MVAIPLHFISFQTSTAFLFDPSCLLCGGTGNTPGRHRLLRILTSRCSRGHVVAGGLGHRADGMSIRFLYGCRFADAASHPSSGCVGRVPHQPYSTSPAAYLGRSRLEQMLVFGSVLFGIGKRPGLLRFESWYPSVF